MLLRDYYGPGIEIVTAGEGVIPNPTPKCTCVCDLEDFSAMDAVSVTAQGDWHLPSSDDFIENRKASPQGGFRGPHGSRGVHAEVGENDALARCGSVRDGIILHHHVDACLRAQHHRARTTSMSI